MNGINLIKKEWQYWPYKNTTYLVISVIIFFFIADTDFVQNILKTIAGFGYLGAFICGVFFVSIFTVVPATAILFNLADVLNPWEVATFAGIGAVLGDYFIFRFLRDRVFDELHEILNKMGGSILKKLFYTPYFTWLLPLLGAFVIASPLPDEAGISLLGLSKIKNWQFVILSFLLNSIGIFIIIIAARSF